MLYHRMNIVLMHDVIPNLDFEISRLGVPQTSGIGRVECRTWIKKPVIVMLSSNGIIICFELTPSSLPPPETHNLRRQRLFNSVAECLTEASMEIRSVGALIYFLQYII